MGVALSHLTPPDTKLRANGAGQWPARSGQPVGGGVPYGYGPECVLPDGA